MLRLRLLLSRFNLLLLPKLVNATVSITLSTDEFIESESSELMCVNAICIQMFDIQLDRGMKLGSDQLICGALLGCDKPVSIGYPESPAWICIISVKYSQVAVVGLGVAIATEIKEPQSEEFIPGYKRSRRSKHLTLLQHERPKCSRK
ncbi:hypothetical protein Ddye_026757 [Dipteronia dyeriana]|uniref:Uncharacterized protein n=1 Tax=Dipteronia dyeriana TaxID=168575 RepID=A0AAD9TMS0_9ROSI|nr:hypothetical protein Ddye_026757 [Dipteronia dyeriana]